MGSSNTGGNSTNKPCFLYLLFSIFPFFSILFHQMTMPSDLLLYDDATQGPVAKECAELWPKIASCVGSSKKCEICST